MSSEQTHPAPNNAAPDPDTILRTIDRRSFCTIATVSPAARPHVAGVLYELADRDLYFSTLRSSRKARNIAENAHVGVCILVRRLPVGPPSSIQFQSTAKLLATDDPTLRTLVDAGHLTTITSHGELDLADGCMVRIPLPGHVLTYGLGMSLRRLLSDPLHAGGRVTLRG